MKEMITPPAALEALLFAAGEPLEKKQVADILGLSADQLRTVLDALTDSLSSTGLAIIETEKEVELRTVPEAAVILKKLRETELSRDLGKGSLETLAVIAYEKEGATRGEIDWIRGVNSSASLRTLLLRGLIEGKEDPHDKRRIRYTITTDTLAHLGIPKISDLPRAEELQRSTRELLEEKAAQDAKPEDA